MSRTKSILLLIAIMSSTPTGAWGQSADECGAIDDGAERLLCYDLQFRVERDNPPPIAIDTQWVVRTETSRIDDSTNVYMTVDSLEDFSAAFGMGRASATLMLRCQENTTSVIITMGGHHLADIQDYGRVTYRIDDAPAAHRNFISSTDNRALGLWNGGSAIPFIQQFFGAENLLIQVTPFSESPITVDFLIAGLEEEIAPLREACSW